MAFTATARTATARTATARASAARSRSASARPRTATSRTAPAHARTAPRLTLVTRPRPHRSSVPFALLCTMVIVGTLFAVLMLNISMSETSYELTRLRGQSIALTEQQQELRERSEQLGTPQELEKRAREIGMVPAGQPAYIDVKTGKIIGEAQPAAGQPAAQGDLSLPPAQIYGESEPYYGMGNEGH